MSFDSSTPAWGRRGFLTRAALAATATTLAVAAPAQGRANAADARHHTSKRLVDADIVPFWGAHQAGIATPMQAHTYFIAFDLLTEQRDDVIRLLKAWTAAAAQMSAGPAHFDAATSPDGRSAQSGAAVGLPASRLTLTFGFGPTLFTHDGRDRFGLAALRPEALAELPRFVGDQLVPEHCGGDLSVQACADNPQVVEAAVRRLARLANGVAVMRWAQTGFSGSFPAGHTGRNTMGFKDGTLNIATSDAKAMNQFVWVGDEGPHWIQGGSYMVIRPIRIALDHWDDMKTSFQEETVGRVKNSGAPIGKRGEQEALELDRADAEGNPVTNENSHASMSAPENNDGAQILRRAYSYDNGIAKIAERWPPWRQVMTFDAGLLFQCYQRDPRAGFVKMFTKMAAIDMLNQFTTHVGSGVFACPPGVQPGEFIGQGLFS